MKFEKPIAEIQKFELEDVISASNTDPTNASDLYNIDADSWADDGICHGDARDNGSDSPNCIGG